MGSLRPSAPRAVSHQDAGAWARPLINLDKATSDRRRARGRGDPPEDVDRQVKLVDTNVLLYAVHEEAEHHARSNSGWTRALSSRRDGTAALGQRCSVSYGSAPTPPSIPNRSRSNEAFDIIDDWLAVGPRDQRRAGPSPRSTGCEDLLVATGTGGNLVNDAHLGGPGAAVRRNGRSPTTTISAGSPACAGSARPSAFDPVSRASGILTCRCGLRDFGRSRSRS